VKAIAVSQFLLPIYFYGNLLVTSFTPVLLETRAIFDAMSRYLAILFLLVALPAWSQLFSVRSAEGGNVPACVRLTPVLPKSQFPEISVLYRTQFIVADTSGNTVSIMKVTSSAGDLMPTWRGDTLSLVFNYAAFAGSDIIVHRSLMIETAGCEVNLELEYRPSQLRPVMIATDRSAYTLNDTLFVTVNERYLICYCQWHLQDRRCLLARHPLGAAAQGGKWLGGSGGPRRKTRDVLRSGHSTVH
jgi:hypothetical protein